MSIEAMNRVWKQSKQSGSDLLLMLAIADCANDRSYCWPGEGHLAGRTRMSLRNTKRQLIKLEEAGELYRVKDKGRGRKTFYIVATGLEDPEIEGILIDVFKVAPLEAKFAVSEWRQKGNRSIYVHIKDDILSVSEDGSSEPDLVHLEDKQSAQNDNLQSKDDRPGAKDDTRGRKDDKSGRPYKEIEPSCNRHESPLESPIEPSVNRHARFAPDDPRPPTDSVRFFWTLDDDDPGGFSKKQVRDGYERVTKKQATKSDREQIELTGAEFPFSSACVVALLEKIASRAKSSIGSFAYFRAALDEIWKRCDGAAKTAGKMATGASPDQARAIILRAVRREIKSWEERAA